MTIKITSVVFLAAALGACTTTPPQSQQKQWTRIQVNQVNRLGTEAEIRARNVEDLCTAEDEIQQRRAALLALQSINPDIKRDIPKHLSEQSYEHRSAVAQSCACSRRGICG